MFKNSTTLFECVKKHSVFASIQASIGLLGIVCNVLSICVFERKQLKSHSYSFYWKVKACVNSWLLLHTFRLFAKNFLNFDIDLISSFCCRFSEYQPFVVYTIDLYLETLITVDRYFINVYQNRFKITKQRSFQIFLISLTVVYSLVSNSNLVFYYRLDEVNGTWVCHIPNRN